VKPTWLSIPSLLVVTTLLAADGSPANPGVNPVSLRDMDAAQVRLLPGSPFYERQELHRHGCVASFQPDKLLFHYRAPAKLPQPEGVTGGYDGWDSGFIRGHRWLVGAGGGRNLHTERFAALRAWGGCHPVKNGG